MSPVNLVDFVDVAGDLFELCCVPVSCYYTVPRDATVLRDTIGVSDVSTCNVVFNDPILTPCGVLTVYTPIIGVKLV